MALMSVDTISAAWFGSGIPAPPPDSATIFNKDASKALESGKIVGTEKLAEAKAKAREIEQKAKKSVQGGTDKIKKTSGEAVEEGKGLLGDIKTRLGRVFGKSE